MAITSPFFCRAASSLSRSQPAGRSVLSSLRASCHEVRFAGVTGCIRTPPTILFQLKGRSVKGSSRRWCGPSRVVESIGDVVRNCSIER